MNKEIILSASAPAPIGPYSQAVLIQNLLFVSGQIALDPESGQMVNASLKEETSQVMQNIKAILTQAGLTFDNVVKSSIFITNMDNFTAINEIYGAFFTSSPPARETVEVSGLPKNAQVEISVIAFKN